LRDVLKFADVTALVEAITLDVQHTQEVLAVVEVGKIEPGVKLGLNEIET
jgi:hypothetical protein